MTSETGSLSVQRMHENAETLRSALSEALQFSPNKAASLVVSDAQINGFVDEEVSSGRVSVDSNGLTAGMRRHLLPPAQSLLASWAQAKGAFVTAIQPFMSDIDAVDSLDGEIQELKKRREADVEQIKREARSDRNYVHLEQDWDKKKKAFEDRHYRVGQRKVTMAAYNPLYWVAMLSTLAAEWLINYDTFYIFMGVPAIAAGTTIILGVLLVFSADTHGTLLKQWGANFGRDVSRDKKRSGYFRLALATFGLTVVLWAAGGFRYAIAIHLVSGQPQINILGAQATIVINPLRDVLLSLLANVAAWAVGVFLAYTCHDENPELMGAKYEFERIHKLFSKKDKATSELIKTREAQVEREIAEKQRSAAGRARDVSEQRHMRDQIRAHEQTVTAGILGSLERNTRSYRDRLVKVANLGKGAITISRGDTSLTPSQYAAIEINIAAEHILSQNGFS